MEIEFDLIGVDAPIANALRRILIAEVRALGHVAVPATLPVPCLGWDACAGSVACAVVDGVSPLADARHALRCAAPLRASRSPLLRWRRCSTRTTRLSSKTKYLPIVLAWSHCW